MSSKYEPEFNEECEAQSKNAPDTKTEADSITAKNIERRIRQQADLAQINCL